jgi:hypothetical protein
MVSIYRDSIGQNNFPTAGLIEAIRRRKRADLSSWDDWPMFTNGRAYDIKDAVARWANNQLSGALDTSVVQYEVLGPDSARVRFARDIEALEDACWVIIAREGAQ